MNEFHWSTSYKEEIGFLIWYLKDIKEEIDKRIIDYHLILINVRGCMAFPSRAFMKYNSALFEDSISEYEKRKITWAEFKERIMDTIDTIIRHLERRAALGESVYHFEI